MSFRVVKALAQKFYRLIISGENKIVRWSSSRKIFRHNFLLPPNKFVTGFSSPRKRRHVLLLPFFWGGASRVPPASTSAQSISWLSTISSWYQSISWLTVNHWFTYVFCIFWRGNAISAIPYAYQRLVACQFRLGTRLALLAGRFLCLWPGLQAHVHKSDRVGLPKDFFPPLIANIIITSGLV